MATNLLSAFLMSMLLMLSIAEFDGSINITSKQLTGPNAVLECCHSFEALDCVWTISNITQAHQLNQTFNFTDGTAHMTNVTNTEGRKCLKLHISGQNDQIITARCAYRQFQSNILKKSQIIEVPLTDESTRDDVQLELSQVKESSYHLPTKNELDNFAYICQLRGTLTSDIYWRVMGMGTVSSKPITAAVHHHVDGFTRNLIAGVTLSAEPRANITCSLSDYDFCFYLNIIVHKQNPLDSLHIKIKCEHRTRKRIYYSRPFNLTIPGDLDLTTPADPTISNELNNSKDSSASKMFLPSRNLILLGLGILWSRIQAVRS